MSGDQTLQERVDAAEKTLSEKEGRLKELKEELKEVEKKLEEEYEAHQSQSGAARNSVLERPKLEGWLAKQGRFMKTWKHRYFVLRYGTIEYFTNSECLELKGSMKLRSTNVVVGNNRNASAAKPYSFSFTIVTPGRVLALRAASKESMQTWIKALRINSVSTGFGSGNMLTHGKDAKKAQSDAAAEAAKLLLLGVSEAGKSTFQKQMRILHMGGFSEDDRINKYRKVVVGNTVQAMRFLLRGARKLDIPIGEADLADAFDAEFEQPVSVLNEEQGELIARLWRDEGVQRAFLRSNEFTSLDCTAKFLTEVRRIASPSYVPTELDVLSSRKQTTQKDEITFEYERMPFVVTDVGGQRNERRMWSREYPGTTAIIFLASLVDYDMVLREDYSTNRMEEAELLFDELVNQWFPDTPIILFLNKKDLFEAKLKHAPLQRTYADYQGTTVDDACDYIRDRFMARVKTHSSETVYPFVVSATDTYNIHLVFESVRDIVCNSMLSSLF